MIDGHLAQGVDSMIERIVKAISQARFRLQQSGFPYLPGEAQLQYAAAEAVIAEIGIVSSDFEKLSDALFNLSDKMHKSNFFDSTENCEAYERVCAAFETLSPSKPRNRV